MALPYYIYQDNRRTGTNLWYARATHYGTVTLDDLAKEVQTNCSLKISDCLAVNLELLSVIKAELNNSNKVKLDNFGSFAPAIKSKGALAKDEFSVEEHIKGSKVNFVAQWRRPVSANGRATSREWTDGVTLKRVPGALLAPNESGH